MRIISCFKMFKIWCTFQKWRKKFSKSFFFLDNFISIGCGKFSVVWRKYLSSAISLITNSPKISDITKRDIFQLHFPHSNEKIWSKCCRVDFSSLSNTLACWLSRGVLKRGPLAIYLTTSLTVRNFGNT